MSKKDSISQDPSFQPFPIIPSKNFQEPYHKILNQIHGILTKTERRLLSLFERYCFKDGKIFPKQQSIAYKLGITVRQVRRILKALVEKGFIQVNVTTLLERHLFCKGNTYHLLNHPAYPQMSAEMSAENGNHTIISYKDIKTKSGFDILEWLKLNGSRHEQSIVDALAALTKKSSKIKFPWQYAQKVVDTQSGNYYEQDHAASVQQETKEINAGYAILADKMGFSMDNRAAASTTPKVDPKTLETARFKRMADKDIIMLSSSGNVYAEAEKKKRGL